MSEAFERAFEMVLELEGEYSFDPTDPGGETKYGISKRAYPQLDIANLTKEEAKAIYYKDYWLKSGADKLSLPLAWVMFDTAVNHGVSTATTMLRQAKGEWAHIIVLRMCQYHTLVNTRPKLRKFFSGWIRRLVEVSKRCMEYERDHAI